MKHLLLTVLISMGIFALYLFLNWLDERAIKKLFQKEEKPSTGINWRYELRHLLRVVRFVVNWFLILTMWAWCGLLVYALLIRDAYKGKRTGFAKSAKGQDWLWG